MTLSTIHPHMVKAVETLAKKEKTKVFLQNFFISWFFISSISFLAFELKQSRCFPVDRCPRCDVEDTRLCIIYEFLLFDAPKDSAKK